MQTLRACLSYFSCISSPLWGFFTYRSLSALTLMKAALYRFIVVEGLAPVHIVFSDHVKISDLNFRRAFRMYWKPVDCEHCGTRQCCAKDDVHAFLSFFVFVFVFVFFFFLLFFPLPCSLQSLLPCFLFFLFFPFFLFFLFFLCFLFLLFLSSLACPSNILLPSSSNKAESSKLQPSI